MAAAAALALPAKVAAAHAAELMLGLADSQAMMTANARAQLPFFWFPSKSPPLQQEQLVAGRTGS